MSDLSATQCACGGCGCGGRNGLSCGGSCGCNSCTLIIILLLCCGGCGGDGFGLNSGCGNDNRLSGIHRKWPAEAILLVFFLLKINRI